MEMSDATARELTEALNRFSSAINGLLTEAPNQRNTSVIARLEGLGRLLEMHSDAIRIHGYKLEGHTDAMGGHGRQMSDHTEGIGGHARLLDQHGQLMDHHGRSMSSHTGMMDIHAGALSRSAMR